MKKFSRLKDEKCQVKKKLLVDLSALSALVVKKAYFKS
jgi:hypothetical protein